MSARKIVVRALVAIAAVTALIVVVAAGWFYLQFYSSPRANHTLVSAGRRREYLLYLPKRFDRSQHAPLVVSLHGAMLWPGAQAKISQWNRVADAHEFVVAYPSGTTLSGTGTGVLPKVWLMAPEATLAADVRFVADLIDTLEAAYGIDPARIYVTGFSNGGGMAFALSCTLSRRIAAVGTVAAAQSLPWSWCTDTLPVPMITFHGTGDRLVPYGGAPPSRIAPRPLPPVTDFVASWARRNRCAPSPSDSAVAPDVTRREYAHCAGDAAVVLYTVRGGGHAWPGGTPMPAWLLGPTSRDIDASETMWEFFAAHPLAGGR